MAEETHEKNTQKINIQHTPLFGGLWFAAWLFTIGFLHLSFWTGLLALIIWPYFLGSHLSYLLH